MKLRLCKMIVKDYHKFLTFENKFTNWAELAFKFKEWLLTQEVNQDLRNVSLVEATLYLQDQI